MAIEQEGGGAASAVYGRSQPPRVTLPERGAVLGLRWSGVEGAGNQILAAQRLGLTKPSLRHRIHTLGIDAAAFRRN